MSDPIDIVERLREAQSAVDSFRGDLGSAAFEDACRTARHRAFLAAPALLAQLDGQAAEITRLRAALAAQVPQPVAWLCEWIDPEDQSIAWHQYHDASDPMPGEWDDPPQRVTPLCAAPGASPPPAALAVPAGMALVPRKATPEMLWAGCIGLDNASSRDLDATQDEMAAAYRAMLAASQESAPTRGGGVSRNVGIQAGPAA